jgi:hypothetical protein
MVKRTARKAGISEAVSPHWLRHAPRLACDRPWRLAARGSVDARPRQHRHHVDDGKWPKRLHSALGANLEGEAALDLVCVG